MSSPRLREGLARSRGRNEARIAGPGSGFKSARIFCLRCCGPVQIHDSTAGLSFDEWLMKTRTRTPPNDERESSLFIAYGGMGCQGWRQANRRATGGRASFRWRRAGRRAASIPSFRGDSSGKSVSPRCLGTASFLESLPRLVELCLLRRVNHARNDQAVAFDGVEDEVFLVG